MASSSSSSPSSSLPRHVREQLTAKIEDARIADEWRAAARGTVTRHKPRAYQLELLEMAKEKATDHMNTIIVLPTGAGKTMVAALMIDWILTRPRKANRLNRKIVIFMVDRVPLVFQQARALEEQCEHQPPLRVGRFCGDKPHADWRSELNKIDVAVITAGLLQNALATNAFGLDDVDLLIVDEAHHCLKSHPFNEVMKNSYFTIPIKERPVVFGMTASPGGEDTVSTTYLALQKLMDALDSLIIIPKDNAHELQSYVHPPRTEFINVESSADEISFQSMVDQYLNKLASSIYDHQYVFARRFRSQNITLRIPHIGNDMDTSIYGAALQYADDQLAAIAPPCAAVNDIRQLLSHMLAVYVATTEVQELGPQAAIATLTKARLVMKGDGNGDGSHGNGSNGDGINGGCWEWTDDEPEGALIYHSDVYRALDNGTLSSLMTAHSAKATALLSYLVRSLPKRHIDDRTMIFATKRSTAYAIASWITHDARLNHHLRPVVLVGHGNSSQSRRTATPTATTSASVATATATATAAAAAALAMRHDQYSGAAAAITAAGMDFKQQQAVVAKFKSGECNVMVTTSIGEEGLDTPSCNTVIRYDEITTVTGLIQSRGRARHADSTFVLIDDKKLASLRGKERNMMIAIDDINNGRVEVIDKLLLLNAHHHRRFVVDDAKGMLQSYCQIKTKSLPVYHDTSSGMSHKPRFRCVVMLPSSCGLPHDQLTITGDDAATKQSAQNRAAYTALVHLHQLGLLRDHIGGKYYQVLEQHRNAPNHYINDDIDEVSHQQMILQQITPLPPLHVPTDGDADADDINDSQSSSQSSGQSSVATSPRGNGHSNGIESKNSSPNGASLRADDRRRRDLITTIAYTQRRYEAMQQEIVTAGLPASVIAAIRLNRPTDISYVPTPAPAPISSSTATAFWDSFGPATPIRSSPAAVHASPLNDPFSPIIRAPSSTTSTPTPTAAVVPSTITSPVSMYTITTPPRAPSSSSSSSSSTSTLVSPFASLTRPWFCELCQAPASSQDNFEAHLNGAPHRRQVVRARSWLTPPSTIPSSSSSSPSSSPSVPLSASLIAVSTPPSFATAATTTIPSSSSSSPLSDVSITIPNGVAVINEMAAIHKFKIEWQESQTGAAHQPLFSCTIIVRLSSNDELRQSVVNISNGSKKKAREMVSQAMLPLLIRRGLRPAGWKG